MSFISRVGTLFGERVAPQNTVIPILRYERYHRFEDPGKFYISPMIERSLQPIDTSLKSLRFSFKDIFNKDNLPYNFELTLLYRFTPQTASHKYQGELVYWTEEITKNIVEEYSIRAIRLLVSTLSSNDILGNENGSSRDFNLDLARLLRSNLQKYGIVITNRDVILKRITNIDSESIDNESIKNSKNASRIQLVSLPESKPNTFLSLLLGMKLGVGLVPDNQATPILRYKCFHRLELPGKHILNPIIERPFPPIHINEQQCKFFLHSVISKDLKIFNIEAMVVYRLESRNITKNVLENIVYLSIDNLENLIATFLNWGLRRNATSYFYKDLKSFVMVSNLELESKLDIHSILAFLGIEISVFISNIALSKNKHLPTGKILPPLKLFDPYDSSVGKKRFNIPKIVNILGIRFSPNNYIVPVLRNSLFHRFGGPGYFGIRQEANDSKPDEIYEETLRPIYVGIQMAEFQFSNFKTEDKVTLVITLTILFKYDPILIQSKNLIDLWNWPEEKRILLYKDILHQDLQKKISTITSKKLMSKQTLDEIEKDLILQSQKKLEDFGVVVLSKGGILFTSVTSYNLNEQLSKTQKWSLDLLYKVLLSRFNIDELQELCFLLEVNYENISGDIFSQKARGLLSYLEKRQRIPEFVTICKKERPDVPWDTCKK